MYRQIVVPTESEHTIMLPKEFYGLKTEVIAFSLENNLIENAHSKTDIDSFYDGINLDLSGFKFNRDEANER